MCDINCLLEDQSTFKGVPLSNLTHNEGRMKLEKRTLCSVMNNAENTAYISRLRFKKEHAPCAAYNLVYLCNMIIIILLS